MSDSKLKFNKIKNKVVLAFLIAQICLLVYYYPAIDVSFEPDFTSTKLSKNSLLSTVKKKARDLLHPILDGCSPLNENIDLVYTWVNGSEIAFKKSLVANIASNETENAETRAQRFQDFDQLKYSLRSVDENAPWFRNIYIVTNGQIPVWLNTSHPRVKIVSHNEIFENKEHLPTFSSSAIETHLHRISNMTNRWVYMNDDWAFTQKTCFQDFYENGATRIYTINSWTPQWKGVLKAKECPKSCSMDGGVLFRNGECDNDCNLLKCRWDGGDCDDVAAEGDGQQEAYYSTLDYANVLLNSLKNNGGRHYVAHTPHLYDTQIMKELQSRFQVEFNLTSSHRYRKKNDIQYEFMYFHYLNDQKKYLTKTISEKKFLNYYAVKNDVHDVKAKLDAIRRKPKKFICINDILDHDKADTEEVLKITKNWYAKMFRKKSPFEL